MDEHTPEFHRVRDSFANSDWADVRSITPATIAAGYEEFDRWLAAHDRVVAANAWDFCLDEIEAHELNTQQAREGNPYRITEENN